ncbi:RNA-directed DNA polymerase, eukaryota, reverse transcriptase zinc-binding domain protein [Tanacetum coccineum]
MGDFNKVRKQAERHGSIFNVQGADAFNLFISVAGLEEVPLGGCSFTWCHKSATKMSKLDRFLIPEGLMDMCPNISAITLDRYLSDHRPILMHKGEGNSDVLNKRMSVSKSLQDLDKLESMEIAQKAKIKLAIKGDENLKYYRDMDFPNKLNLKQQVEFKNNVTREEIKRVVWDCEVDKSPGLDGFTFRFY